MRNEKVYYGIRILVGAYLIYLAVQLLQGVIRGEEGNHVVMIVAGVLFIAIGVIVIINGIMGLKRNSAADGETHEPENQIELQAEEQEPAGLEAYEEGDEETDSDREPEKNGDTGKEE